MLGGLSILCWGSAMIVLARFMRGRWVNHLSLYSSIWTLSLFAYQLRLINYNYISLEAWVFILTAWIAIYVGSGWVSLLGLSTSVRRGDMVLGNQRALKIAIVCLSCAGLASSVTLAWNIMRSLDSGLLIALIDEGNKIYTLRFNGDLSGVMYIGFLPYAASALAGAYTARLGRVTFIGLLPLIAMTVDGVLSMQRGGILIAIVLFLVGVCMVPSKKKLRLAKWQVATALTLLVAGFFYVTMVRGVPVEFENQGGTLNAVADVFPSFPSLYMYVSAPSAGLSAYLVHPESDGDPFWGRYTFAPFYRLLAKLGLDTYVPYYTAFYSTPVSINSCTYLREIHSDFGPLGIFFFPFCLGGVVTFLESRRDSLAVQVLLAHLYVVVLFSFTLLVMITGYWYISLLTSVLVALFVECRSCSLKISGAPFYSHGY